MIPSFHCSIIPIAERSGAKFCHALFALFSRCKQHLTSVLFHILPCSIPLRLSLSPLAFFLYPFTFPALFSSNLLSLYSSQLLFVPRPSSLLHRPSSLFPRPSFSLPSSHFLTFPAPFPFTFSLFPLSFHLPSFPASQLPFFHSVNRFNE